MPNGLGGAQSPYLLAHAQDPVDWLPWGDAAIERARALDRPILLSVGYAACHWCHVMHSESFLDPEIAAAINRCTVPVKVDREELPDIDHAYQSVCMAVIRQGGWPLTAFLTPDLRPFHIGTYFPPHARFGRPGLSDVLEAVEAAWHERRQEIEEIAEDWSRIGREPPSPAEPPPDALQAAYDAMVTRFDREHGGFGGAPKFPTPPHLSVLVRMYLRDGAEPAIEMLHRTLRAMEDGGIRDQLGGGFHRYSVDAAWRVPHFEKMLYDNALLVPLYISCWQATGDAAMENSARSTLDYMLRELRDPAGGFYSAQDADSPAGEGAYFTWTAEEMRALLGADAPLCIARYGVGEQESTVEGRSVLRISSSDLELAEAFGITPDDVKTRLRASVEKLLAERGRRPRPKIDDKVLTGWNGLAITALSRAYLAFGEERYRSAALQAADFLLSAMQTGGHLFRRWYRGEAGIEGYLEDYAYLAEGLYWLYAASFDERYLAAAVNLTREAKRRFWDPASATMHLSSASAPSPLGRQADPYDGALPAAQSVALRTALLLSGIAPDLEAEALADAIFASQGEIMRRAPLAAASLTEAADLARHGATELTLVGPPDEESIARWQREIGQQPVNDLLLTHVEAPRTEPLWRGKTALSGAPTIYACLGTRCAPPVQDLSAARAWLRDNR
jgi:uncharacterized protein YyaL (SSP411 family)